MTGDGGEKTLTGAGVTRGEGATDAASALLRVSGGAGTVGCCHGGPGGNGTRGCCVMGLRLLLYFLMTIQLWIAIYFDMLASVLYDALIVCRLNILLRR